MVITGGSAGFGLAMGRQFGGAGAVVVLLGRSESRLEESVEGLKREGIDGFGVVADLSDDSSVDGAVAKIISEHGQIDVWVNNVGQSVRVSAEDAKLDDFRASLESNLYTAIRGSQAALPHLTRSRGHLINVGSLSSKTAWPFVGPYTVSKHALAGYTSQLRIENGESVHVMLVCPGPIARPDSGRRYGSGDDSVPESASKPGAGAPVSLLDPDRLARQVMVAAEKRKLELIVPWKARLLFMIQAVFPRLGQWILNRSGR